LGRLKVKEETKTRQNCRKGKKKRQKTKKLARIKPRGLQPGGKARKRTIDNKKR